VLQALQHTVGEAGVAHVSETWESSFGISRPKLLSGLLAQLFKAFTVEHVIPLSTDLVLNFRMSLE